MSPMHPITSWAALVSLVTIAGVVLHLWRSLQPREVSMEAESTPACRHLRLVVDNTRRGQGVYDQERDAEWVRLRGKQPS